MFLKKSLTIFPLILFFFAIFTYHTLYRHLTYNSHAFDLGIYTQVTYLYSQGFSPISSLKHMNILGDHFGPILFFLSPIYKLFPYPETLLIIQALFVSLSGIFIYLICLDKTNDKLQSMLITFVYLGFSGILSAINFDFHLATISVLPLSLILYSWYFKKWKLYFLFSFLSLLFKEDIPLFIVGLGMTSFLQKQKKVGILSIILGFLSYYLIKYQIMARIYPGAENAYINTISIPLTNPSQLLFLFSNSPIKIHTIIALYGQFLFLPFLSALSWLTVFPYLFIRFSSHQSHYWGTHFHYNANLAPFLAVSAIFALKKIQFPKYLINILLILAILTSNIYLNRVILDTIQLNFKDIVNFSYLNEIKTMIPIDKAISAQSPIVPHLANIPLVNEFPNLNLT